MIVNPLFINSSLLNIYPLFEDIVRCTLFNIQYRKLFKMKELRLTSNIVV